jgi:hypothetical protein
MRKINAELNGATLSCHTKPTPAAIPIKSIKITQDGSASNATGPIRTRWSNLFGSVPGAFKFKVQRLTFRALPDS